MATPETLDVTRYTGDPQELINKANSTADVHGSLEKHLGLLAFTQDELYTAIVSAGAGKAVYNVLGEAHRKGKALSATLASIIQQLKKQGVEVDASDLEGAAKMQRLMGGDGIDQGGAWSNADPSKIKDFAS
ncbi:hypothetical protein ACLMAL_36205 [Nocardia sp. CWNU-33]|uniref:hypothetical protein n=1 Tax=Nocardia sp. CWNU-33 TaxID=3392117 RepID=UPI00398F5227